MFDILVAGEINPDLILTGDVDPVFGQVEKVISDALLRIGSSSCIFACGAAKLGLKVAFIGKCGDDIFGKFMLEKMSNCKIDLSHVQIVKNGNTGISIILVKGENRAILTYQGLISSLTAKEITNEFLRECRHLHVASYFLQTSIQKDLADLFQRAHQLGLTTSLDTNYDVLEKWEGVDELLPFTDVFLPNEKEILSLTRTKDVNQAFEKISKNKNIVATKLGPKGAIGCNNNEVVFIPALQNLQVMDTIGAGDNFDAGFIYGFLQHWPLIKSLKMGVICGGLSTQKLGGTNGQPSLEEALNYVS